MPNPFVHNELATTDVASAKTFYGQLFSWKLDDVPMPSGPYTIIDAGGGMMQQMIPGAPSAWLPYVLVDDIKAATEKAKSLGASIMHAVMVGFVRALLWRLRERRFLASPGPTAAPDRLAAAVPW